MCRWHIEMGANDVDVRSLQSRRIHSKATTVWGEAGRGHLASSFTRALLRRAGQRRLGRKAGMNVKLAGPLCECLGGRIARQSIDFRLCVVFVLRVPLTIAR